MAEQSLKTCGKSIRQEFAAFALTTASPLLHYRFTRHISVALHAARPHVLTTACRPL